MSNRRLALAGLLAAVTCTACSHASPPPAHVLRIADWSEPSSLNPLLARDQDTIGFDLLFAQTLIGLSAGNKLVPVLVTRVPSRENGDISDDGRNIVYHLRPGIRFADGHVLTSRDVAFTYRAIMDPRNPVLSSDAYRRIASLTTPDDRTVVVRLRSPWNAAVRELFAQSDFAFGILPAHAFVSTVLQHASWEEHAFGTGPFRVTQWRRGDRVILERNPFYAPKPKLERIELRLIPDLNGVVVALRAGEADVARLTAVQVPQAAAIPGMRVIPTPINGADYLTLQTTAPPTDDVRVRHAIADATNLEEIEKAFHRLNPLAGAFLPPVLEWHDAALLPVAENGRAAGAELDAAGWRLQGGVRAKNGAPLEVLIVSQTGLSGEFTAIVQRELAAVGIRATIKSFPAQIFNGPDGPLRTGHFNIASQGWIGGADPEQSITFACSQIGPNGNNIARFCDKEFERAFADQAVTPDQRRRAADFRAMQRIVYDRLPVISVDYIRFFDAVSNRVSGFARNMLGFPVNAENWDVYSFGLSIQAFA
ncbi:MAG TPA: peptide ABC transporter substrate-binding protein [Candidatus Nitrosotalea sp.]|nr:peptide ABC transporter substrate-binding protein [Candidatus Nitrosotalea sp.]